jgi:phosphatidylethanolamine-binding protein (PEBP) family uncharacterized protein
MRGRATYWLTVAVLVAACIIGLYFDFSGPSSDEDQPPLSVRFSWAGIPACATISPAFELGGVPSDTKSLSFMMTDLDMPSFHHGGSTVPYSGNVVQRGVISYTGPCPPPGQKHNYRWTVQAIDASGKVLAKGSVEATFPP